MTDDKNPKPDSNNQVLQSLVLASQFVISIAVLITAGAYLGDFIDKHWHTTPICSLCLAMLGFGIGIFLQIRQINKQK